MAHHMISATGLAQAESGAIQMGRTVRDSLLREDGRHRWQYPDGVVWFNSIILLDDVENCILRGLKFLDTWLLKYNAQQAGNYFRFSEFNGT